MEIKRDLYLNKLIGHMHSGEIKIVTGIRRCGKSYLLKEIFCKHLKSIGVDEAHIILIDLEDRRNAALRNPDNLLKHIDSRINDEKMHYIILDEVQVVDEFEDVLNSYLSVKNADVYVTGSNSRFLSKDVVTEFRGRGWEINVTPLSFAEYLSSRKDESIDVSLQDYLTYGGLPRVALLENNIEKQEYLNQLFRNVYLKDIKERYNILHDDGLLELVSVMASGIGGFTNPTKIENTFRSVKGRDISNDTIGWYLEIMQDAYLIEKAIRYDIKGRKYIETPAKYYFNDLGLRNARLGFRQVEFTHLMENCIYTELRRRGYSVDVGQVNCMETNEEGKMKRKALEVDFVCNQGYTRYYIQSAYAMPDEEKLRQEIRSLKKINDGFQKVVILGTPTPTYMNDDGIIFMNLINFLLNPKISSI